MLKLFRKAESVEIDDENNIVVKNVNEQQSLFGKVGK